MWRKFYLAEIKFYVDLWNIKARKRRKMKAIKLANELSKANRGQRFYVFQNSQGRYYVMDRAEFRARAKFAYRKNSFRKKQHIDTILKEAVYYTPEIKLTDAR